MATTDFGALSGAQKKVWAAEVWQAGRDANFWMSNGWTGSGNADTGRPINRITELTATERGDVCVMQLVADLVGDGVVGDNELTGNEEAMFNDVQEIRIDQLRHGVRNKGAMSEQRTVIRFRSTAKGKLSFWLADKIDEIMFLTASGVALTLKCDGSTRTSSQLPSLRFAADITAPSTNRILYAGSATSTATLTTSDKLTWDLVVKANAFAKRQRIKPIRSGGKEYYGMVISTEQSRDLRQDATYKSLNAKAMPPGERNPLFTGALSIIDGIILYDHNKVCTTLGLSSGSKWGAAGTVDGAQALLLGAQAMGFATIGGTSMTEADTNDYGNRPGLSVGRMLGFKKPVYKAPVTGTSEDFGVVSIYTAAAA